VTFKLEGVAGQQGGAAALSADLAALALDLFVADLG